MCRWVLATRFGTLLTGALLISSCGGTEEAPPPKAAPEKIEPEKIEKPEGEADKDNRVKADQVFKDLSAELDKLSPDTAVDPAWLRDKLMEVVKLDPGHPMARFDLGALALRAGETAAARAQFEAVAKSNPDFAPARENLAYLYVKEGKTAEARAIYEYFIKKDPANITSRLGKARLLATEGKYDEAIELCRKVLQRRADALEAFRILARAYRAVGNTPMAELIIGRGMKIDKDDPELHYIMTEILAESANLAAYVDKLKEVVRMRPDWVKVRARLAAIALEYRDFGNASIQYEAIAKEKPDDRPTKIGLAVSYTGLGRFKKAEEIYLAMLETDPKDLDAMWNLAALYHHRSQNFPEAKKYYGAFANAAPEGDENKKEVPKIIEEIVKIEQDVAAQNAREERARKKQEAIVKSCELIAAGQPPGENAEAIGKEEERIETAWGLLTKASEFVVAGDQASGDATFACAIGILPDTESARIGACAPMRIVWTRDILFQLGRLEEAVACIEAAVVCDEVSADALLIRDQLTEIIAQKAAEEAAAAEAAAAAAAAEAAGEVAAEGATPAVETAPAPEPGAADGP